MGWMVRRGEDEEGEEKEEEENEERKNGWERKTPGKDRQPGGAMAGNGGESHAAALLDDRRLHVMGNKFLNGRFFPAELCHGEVEVTLIC
eukprot:317128-Amphidinium_carterae.1